MSPEDRKQQERWKGIARRVSQEEDPQKLVELTNELIDALNEPTPGSQPDSKPSIEQKDEPAMRKSI